ncbi:MAG TPA: glycosyltransferase family 4 protein [Tepidisphaeraceae bacterium]|jgi:glycosyltransferase involved in cell wall biosynthesis
MPSPAPPAAPEASLDAPALPGVAIVCDNASLRQGGESARPVHYFRVMRSRGMNVFLCTHERVRGELTQILGDDIARVRFTPDTWWHKALYKMSKPFPHQFAISTFGIVSILWTHRHQRAQLRDLVQNHGVQIVHQPVPISPKQPSGIMDLGVPVVIGPLNGDINYPPAFSYMENKLVKLSVGVGRAGGKVANFLVRGKQKATVVLVSNERTRRALPPGIKGRVIQLTANAVDLNSWDTPRSITAGDKPRFGFLGRLVDFKMVDLLLEAFVPLAKQYDAHLDVIGDGDQRPKLEAIARQLGIASHVTFHGYRNYRESAAILAKCYALVFPSLRECGGAVVMESMSAGVPVIAADWGGPADYVGDDAAGMLVKPDTREGFVSGLTAAMTKLAADPQLMLQMSDNARRRAEREFQWDSRVDALIGIYRQVLSAAPPVQ